MGVNDMYQQSLRAFLKPVIQYMDDPAVSEIMINGPEEIWIEARGKLTLTDAKFTAEGLMGAARNMAQFVGRILNDERPRLDARLPDGSRIHIVIPPIARKGTTISIRKFMQGRPGIEKLIEWGSMTPQMAYLIKAMVHSKLNIIVAGGTGSGKTTLLNIVSTLIPNDERIITIEDSAELQMQQDHIVPFESRPADKFGKGEVNMGHLLHSSLRLRPDRIVVGEVRGGEAFDLMQAMNTGHGGSMATTHANTPTDTLRRLESLCLMSSIDMPLVAIRAQVASAINAIITCERFHDGSRKTTAIAEVLPLDEKGEYRTRNLFVFAPTHKDAEGHIHGYHAPTGMLPSFLPMLQSHGFADIKEDFFDPKTYGMPPPPNFMTSNIVTYWAPSLKNREKGLPDSDEIQDQIARASEYAEIFEKQHCYYRIELLAVIVIGKCADKYGHSVFLCHSLDLADLICGILYVVGECGLGPYHHVSTRLRRLCRIFLIYGKCLLIHIEIPFFLRRYISLNCRYGNALSTVTVKQHKHAAKCRVCDEYRRRNKRKEPSFF